MQVNTYDEFKTFQNTIQNLYQTASDMYRGSVNFYHGLYPYQTGSEETRRGILKLKDKMTNVVPILDELLRDPSLLGRFKKWTIGNSGMTSYQAIEHQRNNMVLALNEYTNSRIQDLNTRPHVWFNNMDLNTDENTIVNFKFLQTAIDTIIDELNDVEWQAIASDMPEYVYAERGIHKPSPDVMKYEEPDDHFY